MYKKLIAITLICILLVSISPAVAAENAPANPTVEEILNEYHEARLTQRDEGASTTYSPRSGSSKSLEQETVDTLNAAGYEAYNVTSSNYYTLEAQLNTDFADMGLDPDGSYLIVIRGEDSDALSTNTRAIVPEPDLGGDYFEHTYNGKTYKMRYLTITPADNSNLGQTSNVPIATSDIPQGLHWSVSVLADAMGVGVVNTILSLVSASIPNGANTTFSSFVYHGCTTWTIEYIQVQNTSTGAWRNSSSREYIFASYFTNFTYYNPATKRYEQDSTSGDIGIKYSTNYSNITRLKNQAALAFEANRLSQDTIDEVKYCFNSNVVITHQRYMI